MPTIYRLAVIFASLVLCITCNDSSSPLVSVPSSLVPEVGCSLPENFLSLPEYAQKELEAIWGAYQGGDCAKEKQLSKDVIDIVQQYGTDFEEKTTQGKVAKSSSTDFDYQPGLERSSEAPLRFTSTTPPTPTWTKPHPKLISKLNTDPPQDYLDEQEKESESSEGQGVDAEDPLVAKFDSPQASFLQGAPPRVKEAFINTWNDDDIPSEGLRTHKIQLLAVSLLTGGQLRKYNEWATNRRKVLRAREQELSVLSPAAKRALRQLSNSSEGERIALHPKIKQELKDFIDRHNRRRAARKVAKTA